MIVSDSQQRLEALDSTRSFIVQAPAGSGKTELLTLRYMCLLANVKEPEEVLAITFTRKAASEMRDRIVRSLQSAQTLLGEHSSEDLLSEGARNPLQDPLQRQNFAIANGVLEADALHGWNLARHPSRLRIQTIDSFNIYLANQLPIASRIGGNLSVTTDVKPLFTAAIRATLGLLSEASPSAKPIQSLLAHLDNDTQRVEKMLFSMLQRRDQWLGFLPEILSGTDDTKNYLSVCIGELIDESLDALHSELSYTLPTLIELNNYSAENWLADCGAAPAELSRIPSEPSEALAAWRQIRRLLLTGGGTWRKKVTKNDGFPGKSTVAKERKEFVAAKTAALFEVIGELAEGDRGERIRRSLTLLDRLPSQATLDAQWPTLLALAETLRQLYQRLIIEFTKRGVIDHPQASNAALSALEDTKGPTELALALDSKLSHVLIDEFQDTSERQLTLLESLTAGWTQGDGRTLFVVGDAMQSCYNFRNANVGIYLTVRKHGIGQLRLTPLTLEMNFRSQEPLVRDINRLFSASFPSQENISRGAVTYSPSRAGKPECFPDPVSANWVSYARSEEREAALELEARLVATRISELRGLDPRCSIAVLARNRNHFRAIVPALREAGIPWQATDIDRLSALPVISDLLSLLRALVNIEDRVAWLALLRAPWCGLDSVDLLAVTEVERGASLWHCLRLLSRTEDPVQHGLSEEGLERARALVAALEFPMASRFQSPIRSVVVCAWELLKGDALVDAEADHDAIDYFFLQLEKYETNYSIDDIEEFESIIKQSFVPAKKHSENESSASVQLMTMHKSKGLQFDHVLIPQLAGQSNNDDKSLIELHQRLNKHGEQRLFIATLAEKGDKEADEALYDFIRAENAEKDLNEQTRLVYIAMTRARFSVSLYATFLRKTDDSGASLPLAPAKNNLLARIWEPLQELPTLARTELEVSGESAAQPHSETQRHGLTSLRRMKSPVWIEPDRRATLELQNTEAEREEEHEERDLERTLLKTLGTLSHGFLETYCRQPLDAPSALSALAGRWQRQIERLGAESKHASALVARAHRELLDCIHGDNGWLLDPSLEAAASELKLARRAQRDNEEFHEHYVVDRCFIRDGTRWIIDFKTSHFPAGFSRDEFIAQQKRQYAPQLTRYAELFKGIETLPQRLALYLLSIDELVELD